MLKNAVLILALLAASTPAARAQAPTVAAGGILNHFSFAAPGLPNGGIAQGSIFDIYGDFLGPDKIAQFSGFPIPTEIAGTSVEVTVNGTAVDVYLFFVLKTQIVGVLPSRTPLGNGMLVVTVNGRKSAAVPIKVVAKSIGILSLNSAGSGPAVLQMPDGKGHAPLNSLTSSIQPKQVGILYGTGAGGVTFDESKGAPAQDLGAGYRAFIGGKEAKILFKGRTPGLVGLDQFNIEIPEGLSGCYQSVVFQSGEVVSNFTTISVAAKGGACPDPPVTPQPQTGILRSLNVELERGANQAYEGPLGNLLIVTDFLAAAAGFVDLSKIPPAGPQPVSIQIGPCTIRTLPVQQQNGTPPPADAIGTLDMGSVLTINGPNGQRRIMKQATNGFGETLGMTDLGQAPKPPPLYLDAGTYTVDNGAGGKDVPAFKETIVYPQNFVWTNGDALTWTNEKPNTISLDKELTLTWTGGDPDADVFITGSSFLAAPDGKRQSRVGATFTCKEKSRVGKFTVPAVVVMTLPPSAVLQGVQSTGRIQLSNSKIMPFHVSGIDDPFATIVFGQTIERPALFQ